MLIMDILLALLADQIPTEALSVQAHTVERAFVVADAGAVELWGGVIG